MKKAALLLFSVFLCVTVVAGCSSGVAFYGQKEDHSTSVAQENSMDTDGIGMEQGAVNESAMQVQQRTDARKVIKRADLVLQTTQYNESSTKLESLVTSFGGYIESSSVQGDIPGSDELRSAIYTVRVPSNRLEEFLNSAGNIGTVKNKSISGEDITQNYFDSETRLKTLRMEQDRLLELMEKAQEIEDIIAIEQRLTEVQNEIEQLLGQLKRWDSLISLSTVTVTIHEVRDIIPTKADGLGGQIASVFHVSLHTLTEVCRYLVLAVTAAIPFLAVAAVIVAVILYLRKIIRTRKAQKLGSHQKDDSTPNTK
ncbi:MAG: DUF4349 domain-containing protein [Oscillospiraceae bacterium]